MPMATAASRSLLGSPALGPEWHVAADGAASATPTVAILNPGANDASVRVQTIVNGVGVVSERFLTATAGTVTLINVRVPASRPQMTVEVKSTTASAPIAAAGLVTYQDRRGRPGPVSIVTGATLDARRSVFATPGPGGNRSVTMVLENESAVAAQVQIAIGQEGTVKTSVAAQLGDCPDVRHQRPERTARRHGEHARVRVPPARRGHRRVHGAGASWNLSRRRPQWRRSARTVTSLLLLHCSHHGLEDLHGIVVEVRTLRSRARRRRGIRAPSTPGTRREPPDVAQPPDENRCCRRAEHDRRKVERAEAGAAADATGRRRRAQHGARGSPS